MILIVIFRSEINRVVNFKDKGIVALQEQVSSLETELATKDSELVQERQIKEDLFHQASAVAQSQDSERKYLILWIFSKIHFSIVLVKYFFERLNGAVVSASK